MKISAYVPCFNNRDTLAFAIESVRAQSQPVDEIFVVDNASTDGSPEVAGVRVVRLEKNSGRGGSRARAMHEAQHELVLCCDATVALDRDFARNALPWFRDERVAAVFGFITQPPPRNAVERWRGRHLFKNTTATEAQHGASLATGGSLLRGSAVRRVGGFDATLGEGEDADLGARLLAAGCDVIFDPKLFVTATKPNTLREVLERYARWNTHAPMGVRDYARQIVYSIKVMAREDLRAGDPLAALISLASPHCQFVSSFKKRGRNRR